LNLQAAAVHKAGDSVTLKHVFLRVVQYDNSDVRLVPHFGVEATSIPTAICTEGKGTNGKGSSPACATEHAPKMRRRMESCSTGL